MKERKSNFELLRIVAMLFIILGHSASHGIFHFGEADVFAAWQGGSLVNKAFSSLLLPGGAVGVGIFFMITGYFQVEKEKYSIKKVLLQVLFYGLVISALYIVYLLVKGAFTAGMLWAFLKNFFLKTMLNPLSGGSWWYVTAYFLIMLFSPLLNAFLKKLSPRGFMTFLMTLCIIWYGISYLTGGTYIQAERGLLFYSIGAYIKLHGDDVKVSAVKCFSCLVGIWITGGLAYYFYSSIMVSNNGGAGYTIMADLLDLYIFMVVTPLAAVSLFLWFKGLNMGRVKVINRIAGTTLGIYLIHDSEIFRTTLWQGIFHMDSGLYGSGLYPLYAIGISIIIFLAGMLIDLARQMLIQKPLEKTADKIEDKIRKRLFQ